MVLALAIIRPKGWVPTFIIVQAVGPAENSTRFDICPLACRCDTFLLTRQWEISMFIAAIYLKLCISTICKRRNFRDSTPNVLVANPAASQLQKSD